ncbi:MAG: SEC-C domain-containing protein, partial [Planctomycetales bacterium]|nr:SEC-C domain-containing protein [Planctomycetales bacterium]
TYALEASRRLGVMLDARDFRGADGVSAERVATDEAERMAESQVLDAIDENLPEEEDESEWQWESLAKFFNARWNLNLRDRDLKKIGRDHLAEEIIAKAREALNKVELSDLAPVLEPDFGVQTACQWMKHKFAIEVELDDWKDKETPAVLADAHARVAQAYDEREAEYPVMAGLQHFTMRDASGARYDREKLVEWARTRFDCDLSLDDLRNKQREEIRELLLDLSRRNNERAGEALAEGSRRVAELFGQHTDSTARAGDQKSGNRLHDLVHWLNQTAGAEFSEEAFGRLNRLQLANKVEAEIEEKFRPEMRRMERALVLQILDTGWKDHLLSMDHLKSSVGLRGYAQVDPKVEYKREGMRQFEEMWKSVGDHVTSLIFRMEQLDERFVGSTWKESAAIHEDHGSEIARQQQAAIEASGEKPVKIEPIRNRDERVGRNQPCPCGSGKKFKNCCQRKA